MHFYVSSDTDATVSPSLGLRVEKITEKITHKDKRDYFGENQGWGKNKKRL